MKKRLLITGGAGFIGCNFVHYWAQQQPNDRIVVLDALTYAGDMDNLKPVAEHPNYRFVEGDICDTDLVEKLLHDEQIDTIVHFAAESHVDRSITGPDEFIRTNILGTHSLLKAAKKLWLDADSPVTHHRFHHVSTDEVYGSLAPDDAPFTESHPYAPNSPYSASKASSDHLVRAYQETYGLNTSISNCSNNYGPYQNPEKLIPTVILRILNGQPIPVYGDGSNIRDWLYVEDHCRGIAAILEQGTVGETYNIGGNNEWANIDLVKHICHITDQLINQSETLAVRFPNAPASRGQTADSLISFVTDRAGHDWRYAINSQKIVSELNYQPQQDFAELLTHTINWQIDTL